MERFLIATASGRALTQSAQQAGFNVDVFDLFGDWDLQKSVAEGSQTGTPQTPGRVFSARKFRDLFRLVDMSKYRAAIIGGGLESKIDLVRRLEIPVLGCQASQLKRLQSHSCLKIMPDLVERAGARWPITQTIEPQNCQTSPWILKSLRGSGGNHVRLWPSSNIDPRFFFRQHYVFQRYVDGFNFSALFVAQGKIRQRDKRIGSNLPCIPACLLIGCSQQLVGEPDFGARPFAYCGSIAPLQLTDAIWNVIERLGWEISSEFEIDGLFGIDLIATEEGVWLIEINPRIPASAELYERLARLNAQDSCSVFRTHVDACFGRIETKRTVFRAANRYVAKGILFCKSEKGLIIDETIFGELERLYLADPGSPRKLADIPNQRTHIESGEPILTFFVEADNASAAHRELFQFADQLNQLLDNRIDS